MEEIVNFIENNETQNKDKQEKEIKLQTNKGKKKHKKKQKQNKVIPFKIKRGINLGICTRDSSTEKTSCAGTPHEIKKFNDNLIKPNISSDAIKSIETLLKQKMESIDILLNQLNS